MILRNTHISTVHPLNVIKLCHNCHTCAILCTYKIFLQKTTPQKKEMTYIILLQTCGKQWDLPKFVDVLFMNLEFPRLLTWNPKIVIFSRKIIFQIFPEQKVLGSVKVMAVEVHTININQHS